MNAPMGAETAAKYGLDTNAVYLVGHSMGGNSVVNAAARLPGVRAQRANPKASTWSTCSSWPSSCEIAGLLVARRCEASGEAVAEPLCEPSELNSKTCGEINAVNNADAP